MHSLELLPGVGKKHMWEIIKARRGRPFEGFDDLRKRVTMLPDPKKIVVRRIVEELEGKDGHTLFVSGGSGNTQ
jgi:putative nucleotide binding protein